MNVTTEQGARAQEQRKRQLVLVNDVVHEVRRLGGARPPNSVGKNKDSETGASRCALTSVVDQKQS